MNVPPRAAVVLMRLALLVLCLSLDSVAFGAEPPLFSTPLHLLREISDSVSGSKQRIDEYCDGDRVIAIAGVRTVVTDYKAQTVTRIDRASGTYSVAPFAGFGHRTTAKAVRTWKSRDAAPQTVADRAAQVVELEASSSDGDQRLRVASTDDVKLTRRAAEVLIGAAYPAPRLESAEAVLSAIRISTTGRSAAGAAMYRLPLETISTYDVAGESVEVRSVVVELSTRRAPAELSSIPPGARQVDPPPDLETALRELDMPSVRR